MRKQTKLSDEQVAEALSAIRDEDNSATATSEAKRLGVARTTLLASIDRFERLATEHHAPGVEEAPHGIFTVTSDPITVAGVELTEDGLLRKYGYDPAEHEIVRKRINFWGSDADPHFQLRLDAIPKRLLTLPTAPTDWTPPPKPRPPKKAKHRDVVVISDHHAPFHERTFHKLFLDMLADEQPDEIEVNGDLLDFETISRHRERDGAASVNECLQAGFDILADYRNVCPNAKITYKRGNHEERLQHMLMDNARGLYKITAANTEVEALSLRRLLWLDELHVEYIDVPWDQAKTILAPSLTVRHGVSTSKNAGEQMLDRLRGSTHQGHDHRAGITLRTEYTGDPADPVTFQMGVQGGCACEIPGGLGYVAGGEPNWQNAYGAYRIYEDGDWHASLGLYIKGRLLAHNQKRYTA